MTEKTTGQISRRNLLVAAGALVVPLAAPTVVRGQSTVRLTLGHNAAIGNPRSVAAERMAQQLKERSNGRIDMRVAGAAQLGDDLAVLTGLRTGTVDMSVNSQGPISTVVPDLAAFGLPFLFPTSQAAYRVIDGPVGQELAKKLEGVGLVSLGWWDNGIRHITNSKRSIKLPADLRGLKIRTPADPSTIDTFQALGAATQQINFSELYVALQQGVVDGQENPLANIHSSKLQEVNPFISLSSHQWQCSPFIASRIAWGRLNEADRKLITEVGREATDYNRKLMVESDEKLLAEFRANPKLTINEVDQDAFRAATAPVSTSGSRSPSATSSSGCAAAAGA